MLKLKAYLGISSSSLSSYFQIKKQPQGGGLCPRWQNKNGRSQEQTQASHDKAVIWTTHYRRRRGGRTGDRGRTVSVSQPHLSADSMPPTLRSTFHTLPLLITTSIHPKIRLFLQLLFHTRKNWRSEGLHDLSMVPQLVNAGASIGIQTPVSMDPIFLLLLGKGPRGLAGNSNLEHV